MKKNNEDLQNKVIELLNKSQITGYQIEKDTGITEATISNYRNGKTKPTKANAEILLKYLTSTGEMLKNGTSNIKSVQPFIQETIVSVPFVSARATATFIESCCEEADILETMPVFGITEEELKKYRYIVFEISGNSMEPTIMDKSYVLAKPVDIGNWEYAAGVHIVVYSDLMVVKRIKNNDLLHKDMLTLCSDNPGAGEQTVRKSDIRGMWKVLRVIWQEIF